SHVAADGERHIADVKNDRGLVIELQHSPIALEERLSREYFYEKMVWIVDGMRYKRDLAAFHKAVANSVMHYDPLSLYPLAGTAGMFRRWAPLRRDVFIDFGDEEFHIEGLRLPSVLWQFQHAAIAAVARESFIQFCLNGSELQYLRLTQQLRERYLPNRRGRYLRIGRGRLISY
ncbi:MAG: hypothetical protein ABWZ83_11545, partial [Mesorhizobium sp.]